MSEPESGSAGAKRGSGTEPPQGFAPATRAWFASAFAAPTAVQEAAWAAIGADDCALIIAPTGSGKTLAAFLHAIDRLFAERARDAARSAGKRRQKRATRVLYISPLKALGADVQRNLRVPLLGVARHRELRGDPAVTLEVGMRTGDTPASERAALTRRPPDILITTPESLYLMLTSKARETLRGVDTVIIDEVHAVAGTKRGAHLAVSLERLDDLLETPAQRVGLSATVRPVDRVAAFLGGARPVTVVNPPSERRLDMHIVAPVEDMADLPVPAAASSGSSERAGRAGSIWFHVEAGILDRVLACRSTIVFVNSRGQAERLTARLNELYAERAGLPPSGPGNSYFVEANDVQMWAPPTPARALQTLTHRAIGDPLLRGQTVQPLPRVSHLDPANVERQRSAVGHEENSCFGSDVGPVHYDSANSGTGNRSAGLPPLIARAHHGSVSKERRAEIEQALKCGELRCVVATSSLELGIDMGQVDLVIQVAAPPSVSGGLQRVGRAGHHVGGTSRGLVYPRTRRELVDAAVTVENMLDARLEAVQPPQNPLDILAQQTVAAVAMEPINADVWYASVRRSDPFRNLPRSVFNATMDMLSGRFPSDEFAEFRPRLVWNRQNGLLTARPGAQRLAVVNGGTIPDRGTFSVVLPEEEEQAGSRRVGELDEEMVYESRVNDVIVLGATSWRITQITRDQVVVVPAPGKSARLPFWHGDGPGRPAELGAAIGAFLRAMEGAGSGEGPGDAALKRLQAAGLDRNAVSNLRNLLAEQRGATGVLPTDRTLVLERCRDELGDWRLMLHSPYGRRVHAPWALAVADRIRRHFGVDASVIASDDGIIARIPDSDGPLPGAELFAFAAESLETIVRDRVGASALFAARFRECAARALLLPRRAPGRRSPLWLQRLRAGQLLEVARSYPDFPILLEAARECLQDVYDLPALHALMQRIESGSVRLVAVTTDTPSVFAANLLFGYVGEFMYENDAPLAERRASLLALDPGLLAELLGRTDVGALLDPAVVERVAAELQRTALERRAVGIEGAADLLRELGPLSTGEVVARLAPGDGGASDNAKEAEAYLAALVDAGRAIRVRMAGRAVWAAVEDAARLRDALGLRLPGGIPPVFLEAVADPLRDLVSRYARTHAIFTTGRLAARFGIGVAVADAALARLREQGRLLQGDFGVNGSSISYSAEANDIQMCAPPTPAGDWSCPDPANGVLGELKRDQDTEYRPELPENPLARHEWIWDDVFRRLRTRSLQAARDAAKPVAREAYVRQLLERQYLLDATAAPAMHAAPSQAALQGPDGVARVVEQLAGLALPASLWENAILPSRVRDYSPGMLDALMASGEVLWSGSGRMGDTDGMVTLHLREFAAETLPPAEARGVGTELTQAQRDILALLADGGAYFARQIAERLPPSESPGAGGRFPVAALRDALWGLVWAGHISTDTWASLRAFIGTQSPGSVRRTRTVRRRLPGGGYHSQSVTTRGGLSGLAAPDDPALAGRWSLLPCEAISDTARALASTEGLLDRYGVVTRGVAVAEKSAGGFPAIQRVFRGMEDSGRLLRGRFVDGLGAAQFAERAVVDRLRELGGDSRSAPEAAALSAADPANPYGAAMPWPAHAAKSKPTRRAGALVVIRAGRLALWLAQGGRHLLTFVDATAPDTAEVLRDSAEALAYALKRGHAPTFTLESVDERPVSGTALAPLLREAGFASAPQGLCWYGKRK